MSLNVTTDTQTPCRPTFSNPDISGIGVRTAAYVHVVITLALPWCLPNSQEIFKATAHRLFILATILAIAGISQWRTPGLSSLDATVGCAIQFTMGVSAIVNMSSISYLNNLPRFAFIGWFVAFVPWLLVTDAISSVCKGESTETMDTQSVHLIVVLMTSFSAMIMLLQYDWNRHKYLSRVKVAVVALFGILAYIIVFVEQRIYQDVGARDLNQWTYGQVVPMLSLGLPIFELWSEIRKRDAPDYQVVRERPVLPGADTVDIEIG